MRKRNLLFVCFLLLFVALNLSAVRAADEESLGKEAEQAGNLREAVTHYISALQSVSEGSSKDRQLREKIISLVQKLTPLPAVPEEAQRHLGRGQAAVEIAKTSEDFLVAVSEFKKALRLAPWLANAYFNLAVVQEKAGQFNEAIQNYKLYLLAAPSAADVQDVKTKIYGLELKAELKGKEEKEKVSREEREKQKQETINRFMRMVEGTTYEAFVCTINYPYSDGCNEKEYNNKRNWYPWPGETIIFSFTSDGKILLTSITWGRIIGTIEGPDISNIRWAHEKGITIWIQPSADWSSFTIGNIPLSGKRDFYTSYKRR